MHRHATQHLLFQSKLFIFDIVVFKWLSLAHQCTLVFLGTLIELGGMIHWWLLVYLLHGECLILVLSMAHQLEGVSWGHFDSQPLFHLFWNVGVTLDYEGILLKLLHKNMRCHIKICGVGWLGMSRHVPTHAWHMWGVLHELVTWRNVLGTSCDVTTCLSTCGVL